MKKKFFALIIFAFTLFSYACSLIGDCEQNTGKVSFFISGELASKAKSASSRTVSGDEEGGGMVLDIALKGGFLAQQTVPLSAGGATISFEDIPEGVSLFAEASVYKSINGEKDILYKGKSERVIIQEGDNVLTLVMSPYVPEENGDSDGTNDNGTTDNGTNDNGTNDNGTTDNGTNDNGTNDNGTTDNGTPISYIGSKAPTEAKSVGSIIFSDGSFEDYSAGLTLTEMQSASAVAVIFCLASDSPSGKTLGVGLNEKSGMRWCTGTTEGYEFKFNTSDDDGSGNWAVIQNEDSSAANYPAFNFANTYSVNGFEDGWYLPAINELKKLYNAKSMVNSAIGLIGSNSLGNYTYWSSSQFTSSTAAQYCSFSNGSVSGTAKDDSSNYVRVIHEF